MAYHFIMPFVTNLFLMMKLSRKSNITPALIELHWLPFPELIHLKILLLVYKSINHQGPSYQADMFTPYQQSRALPSSSHLWTAKKRIRNIGERTFAVRGPAPLFIRQSKSVKISKSTWKILLFKTAFQLWYILLIFTFRTFVTWSFCAYSTPVCSHALLSLSFDLFLVS